MRNERLLTCHEGEATMSDFQPESTPTGAPQSPQPQRAGYNQPAPPPYGLAPEQLPGHPQAPATGQQARPGTFTPAQPPTPYQAGSEGRPWLVAALAGVIVGAVVAFVYAALSFVIEREILAAIMAVGGLIGFAVGKVSGRKGILNGIIAALIAIPATLAAVVLLVVFTVTDSISEGLSVLGDVNYDVAIEAYFEDALAYVWFAASIFVAFVMSMRANKG